MNKDGANSGLTQVLYPATTRWRKLIQLLPSKTLRGMKLKTISTGPKDWTAGEKEDFLARTPVRARVHCATSVHNPE
jgi:hypothetical protein